MNCHHSGGLSSSSSISIRRMTHFHSNPFQVSRTVHSHDLSSSLSIPISRQRKTTRTATSSPVAAPQRSAEIWAIWQPGSLQIKHVYSAMDPFQVSRPTQSHLSPLSIPIGSRKTPYENKRPPQLVPSQHPNIRLKSGRSGRLRTWLTTPNQTLLCCHRPLPGL